MPLWRTLLVWLCACLCRAKKKPSEESDLFRSKSHSRSSRRLFGAISCWSYTSNVNRVWRTASAFFSFDAVIGSAIQMARAGSVGVADMLL